ncbi:Pre-mRNA-splicing factor SPF27 [Peziza echinospora]|nr:Pre-mRNA-splicing factor SPF27 [Peziza echinospora]
MATLLEDNTAEDARSFIFDSLPYLDPPLPQTLLTKAKSLITSALPADHLTTPHPSLPPLTPPTYTPLLQSELTRIATSTPLTAIDLTRYDPTTTPPPPPHLLQLSTHHLTTRNTNLTLLSTFGKNAWLVHNDQLEGELARTERELLETKGVCEGVNKERKGMQVVAGSGGQEELERLERRWREGVGRVLRTEVAAEEVRREVLRVRRELAKGK